MKSSDEVERILAGSGGVIARRDHPALTGTLDWLVRTGALAPALPGVYARPALVTDRSTRIRAAAARYPNAVLLGGDAARLTYWPEAPLGQIEIANPTRAAPAVGFSFSRRRVPAELVLPTDGLRVSTPALTAIELATIDSCDAIDIALRTRSASLDAMYEALRLTPFRVGNVDRRKVLLDSRAEPWSAAERHAHRLLRAAGIQGWEANLPTMVAGRLYFIDVAFHARMLAIEVDGRLHESDEDQFETDRWRQNALVLDGWRVLRFTWAMLRDHPEVFVANICRALRL